MKAVIVDLHGKSAAALCEDGNIVKVPDNGYALGQRIDLPDSGNAIAQKKEDYGEGSGKRRHRKIRRGFWRQAVAAAAACFLVLGISAGTVWAMPYGEVQVDAGTWFTYTINRFDYVLDLTACNAEGQDISGSLDRNKILRHSIDKAVEETLEQLEQLEHMEQDSGGSIRKNAVNGAEAAAQAGTGEERSGGIGITTNIKNEAHAGRLIGRLEKIAQESPAGRRFQQSAGTQDDPAAADPLQEPSRTGLHPEDSLDNSREDDGFSKESDDTRQPQKTDETGAEFKQPQETDGAQDSFDQSREPGGAQNSFKQPQETDGAQDSFDQSRELGGAQNSFEQPQEAGGAQAGFGQPPAEVDPRQGPETGTAGQEMPWDRAGQPSGGPQVQEGPGNSPSGGQRQEGTGRP